MPSRLVGRRNRGDVGKLSPRRKLNALRGDERNALLRFIHGDGTNEAEYLLVRRRGNSRAHAAPATLLYGLHDEVAFSGAGDCRQGDRTVPTNVEEIAPRRVGNAIGGGND